MAPPAAARTRDQPRLCVLRKRRRLATALGKRSEGTRLGRGGGLAWSPPTVQARVLGPVVDASSREVVPESSCPVSSLVGQQVDSSSRRRGADDGPLSGLLAALLVQAKLDGWRCPASAGRAQSIASSGRWSPLSASLARVSPLRTGTPARLVRAAEGKEGRAGLASFVQLTAAAGCC